MGDPFILILQNTTLEILLCMKLGMVFKLVSFKVIVLDNLQ